MEEGIKFLEFLKFFTLKGHSVGFRSSSNYIDYIENDTLITTPEGFTFTIKSIRVNLMNNVFTNNKSEKDYMWYDLRNLTTFTSNPENLMKPEMVTDSSFSGNSYKRFVFISKYFEEQKVSNPQWVLSVVNEYGTSNRSYDYFPFSIIILVKSSDELQFRSFLDTSYNFWKWNFDFKINTLSLNNILKYDPRIFSYQLNSNQSINLLENFEAISLPNEYIISILDLKNQKDKIELINYLRNSNTNLNYRLMQHFLDDSSIEDFYKYNESLINLGLSLVNQTSVELIALKEVECYTDYPNANWNLFNKLAERAGVFSISTKTIYNTHFGIFNYFPLGVTVDLNPFNTQYLPSLPNIPEVNIDFNKIHFAYSALYKTSPESDDLNKIIRFPSMDPFRLVKLYIVNEPKELSEVEKYEGFIKQFISPKESKIKVAYLPAISAYNFYILNYRAQHDEIAAKLLQGALLGLGTALTFGLSTPYTIPWYLSTAANMTSILAMTINAPGVKEEILDLFGQENGQEFIDAIDFLANATIVLDFAYAGFYGIRNLTYFVTNKANLLAIRDTFILRYSLLNLRLQKILTPFYKSVFVNIEKALQEAAEYEAKLASHLLPGKSWSWVVQYKLDNGFYPELSLYIKPSSISQYQSLLETEGVTFFVAKNEIFNPNYTSLPIEKFAGITSHMNIAETNFIAKGRDIQQLINDLAVSPNKFTFGDEIYKVHISYNNTKGISMKMPDGNSPGSLLNPDWRPGGFLKTFKNLTNNEDVFAREAVFFKADGTSMIHNNDWNTFVNIFGSENVIRINP